MSGLGPEARALLARARAVEDASLEDRERVRRRLATCLAASTALIPSGAASAPSSVQSAAPLGMSSTSSFVPAAAGVAKAVWLQASLWIASSVALGAGVWVLVTGAPTPVPSPSPRVVATASTRESARTRVPTATESAASPESEGIAGGTELSPRSIASLPVQEVEPTPALAASPRRSSSGPSPTRARPPTERSLSLLDEARELTAIRAALREGQAATALIRLDSLDRQIGGALFEERLAARVLALCALGRATAARATAQRFRALAPRSPLLPQLASSCVKDGELDPQ